MYVHICADRLCVQRQVCEYVCEMLHGAWFVYKYSFMNACSNSLFEMRLCRSAMSVACGAGVCVIVFVSTRVKEDIDSHVAWQVRMFDMTYSCV